MEEAVDKQSESYEKKKKEGGAAYILFLSTIFLAVLFDLTLLICFIVSLSIGDDLMDRFKAVLICHIVGYSIIVFNEIIMILFVFTFAIVFGFILACFSIVAVIAVLYEIGITIWSIVLLIKTGDDNITFLYVILIIQACCMSLSVIQAICCRR